MIILTTARIRPACPQPRRGVRATMNTELLEDAVDMVLDR
jgi:hypothetical protein